MYLYQRFINTFPWKGLLKKTIFCFKSVFLICKNFSMKYAIGKQTKRLFDYFFENAPKLY